MKRFLSSLLVLCMAMTFLPASAAAASVSPFGDVQSTDGIMMKCSMSMKTG